MPLLLAEAAEPQNGSTAYSLLDEKTERREFASAEYTLVAKLTTRIEKMAAYFGRNCGIDPDDLRQEAWIAVLEMLPALDYSIGSPEQHLLKRARWRILDTIRHHRRRQHLGLNDHQVQSLTYFDPQNTIDMEQLNARLTIIQRRILRALLEGYTWREAGSLVGCTSANVAYHVRKIREAYLALTQG